MSTDGFVVILERFARKHYCKDFEKHGAWKATWTGLEQTFARFNADALAGKLEPPIRISEDRNLFLYKMSFRMADDSKGAKSAGNRIIFTCDSSKRLIRILLVYSKNHVQGSRETDWWTGVIYNQYDGLP